MADQTDASLAAPSGDVPTTAPSTALDVLSTVSAIQPEAHATADDVQEAIQQLDKLTEIEDGLAEAALEANMGQNQQQHMQHAEQIEQQMEDQVDGLNLPISGPIIHSEDTESAPMQVLDYTDRGYASSEDAEGEIDLDLGGMDDEDYEQDTYGQVPTYDADDRPIPEVDAYNESSTKDDEAMPLSANEETEPTDTVAETPVVPNDSEVKAATPAASTPPVAQPKVEESKPVSIRRLPGQQRRSPSYNMEPPQPASTNPQIPVPPPFLPARPTTVVETKAPPIRQFPSHFDLSDVTFPEGLSVNSPSVQRHGAWVRAWKGGKSFPHPVFSITYSHCALLVLSGRIPSNPGTSLARTVQGRSR